MSQPSKKCRVFVVHDEPVIASSLALILGHEGFDARFFTEPFEVLKVAHSNAPDILVTDAALPPLSGVELAVRIRQHRPDCKVLLFSVQATLPGSSAADLDSFELIQKPVHPKDLLERIQILLKSKSGSANKA